MNRTPNHWNVQLQREDGETMNYSLSSHWDAERTETPHLVGTTAAAEAWFKGGKTMTFAPIKVERA